MPNAVIMLQTPVEGPGVFIDRVELRPVTYAEYCERGSPFEVIPLPDGETFTKVDRPKLLALALELVVNGGGQAALRGATDPRDFAAIEAAMRNFYLPASNSNAPGASSPSTPESPSPILIG